MIIPILIAVAVTYWIGKIFVKGLFPSIGNPVMLCVTCESEGKVRGRQLLCAKCGSKETIPLDSPRALKIKGKA